MSSISFPPSFGSLQSLRPVQGVNAVSRATPEIECDDLSPDFRGTDPVYAGEVQLLDWAATARSGMTSKFLLRDPSDRIHPLKGMVCGAQYGQRLHAVITTIENEVSEMETDFLGDAVLLGWSDDNINGMSTKLLLGEMVENSAHPLQHRTAGKTGGDLLHLTMWAIDDDESLQPPDQVRRRKPFNEMTAISQSQILCRDPNFQRWLQETLPDRMSEDDFVRFQRGTRPTGNEFAADVVKHFCGIESRAELGWESAHGERARKYWRRILNGYEDWRFGRR